MGDYRDGKHKVSGNNSVSQVNVSQNIDIDALATALAQKMPRMSRGIIGEEFIDDFNHDASLERLADAMIVQRGDNKSNFEDLGNIQETKRDKKDIDKTIDILKNLD